jgi:hypothetical protein
LPEAPAVAVVDAAPVATSKVLPLAIVAAVGLGVLALVLRPNRTAGPGGGDAAVSPVLLAGPSLPALADARPEPVRAVAVDAALDDRPADHRDDGADDDDGTAGRVDDQVDERVDGPPGDAAGPTGEAPTDPADPAEPADPAGVAGAAAPPGVADDLPDVLSLVTQARLGRRATPPPSG